MEAAGGGPPSPAAKSHVRIKLQTLLAEYGPIALAVYFTIFAVVLVGAWTAIHLGWRPESAGGSVGTFAAAYLATKVTQPLRIAATLALTPLVALVHRRFARRPRRDTALPAE